MKNLESPIERPKRLTDGPAERVKANLFLMGARHYLRDINSGQFNLVHERNGDIESFAHATIQAGGDGGQISLARSRLGGNVIAITEVSFSGDEWLGGLSYLGFNEVLQNLDSGAVQEKSLTVTPREISGDFPAVAAMLALRAARILSQQPASS